MTDADADPLVEWVQQLAAPEPVESAAAIADVIVCDTCHAEHHAEHRPAGARIDAALRLGWDISDRGDYCPAHHPLSSIGEDDRPFADGAEASDHATDASSPQ